MTDSSVSLPITSSNVSKAYGGFKALDDVSLDIHPHDTIVVPRERRE